MTALHRAAENNNSNIANYDLETFTSILDFKGLYVYENKVYAFVDLTKLEIFGSLLEDLV
ncbi:MAG: hypothetical protein EBS19_11855 [Spirochaetia bacterium]|nr:hypothetical protein [Spirochaetia bacterium]